MGIYRRIVNRGLALALAALLLAGFAAPMSAQGGGAAATAPLAAPVTVNRGPNTAEQQAKPYVILVSLDGFRYDYPRIYKAPNLEAMAARGASAPHGMIPAYPSITFPNHYTIVTGLYPEHHGIVANKFIDPERGALYNYTDPASITDSSWYGGIPLWSLAESQGMRTASLLWVGSEAKIAGFRPTWYAHYD